MTIFTLNDELALIEPNEYRLNSQRSDLDQTFKRLVVDKKKGKWTDEIVSHRSLPTDGVIGVHSGYLGVLSQAYSMHRKVVLAPHDVWYLMMCEVTNIIANNVEACRPLFTKSSEKIVIEVPTNDFTSIDLNLIEAQLRNLVPVNLDTYLPEFTNITPAARYATLAAFCDGVSKYYDYMSFCCGIPAIKVTGTPEDWALIQAKGATIAAQFTDVGVHRVAPWIERVTGIIDQIIAAKISGDGSFFKDIFTQRNVGSGGQLSIDGWFADLYERGDRNGNSLRGRQMEEYPSGISIVEYKNRDTGREFMGLHGCFMSRFDEDGFAYGDYAETISELSRVPVKKVPEPEVTKVYVDKNAPAFDIDVIKVEAPSRVIGEWPGVDDSVTIQMFNPNRQSKSE